LRAARRPIARRPIATAPIANAPKRARHHRAGAHRTASGRDAPEVSPSGHHAHAAHRALPRYPSHNAAEEKIVPPPARRCAARPRPSRGIAAHCARRPSFSSNAPSGANQRPIEDDVEQGRVVPQPARGRQTWRVDLAAPFAIAPARSSDPEPRHGIAPPCAS
jgi:hypothetical protein